MKLVSVFPSAFYLLSEVRLSLARTRTGEYSPRTGGTGERDALYTQPLSTFDVHRRGVEGLALTSAW